MMEGVRRCRVNVTSPDELKRAVNAAMDSGKPTLDQRSNRSGGRPRERPHRNLNPAEQDSKEE